MASEAYLEALVAMVKGLEKSGRWRTGHERKSFFEQVEQLLADRGLVPIVVLLCEIQ